MTMLKIHRSGFALPAALLALIIVGAIVTGGFYAANQEDKVSASTDRGSEAFYLADTGLQDLLGTERNAFFLAITDTQVVGPETVTAGGKTLGEYELVVRRTGPRLYMVSSEGRVLDGSGNTLASRTLGLQVRVVTAEMPADGAMISYGGVTVQGNGEINGSDAGGPGCTVGDSVAGVVANPGATVDDGPKDQIYGSPPTDTMTMDTSSMFDFGGIDVTDLEAMADKAWTSDQNFTGMGPVESDGVCDTSDPMNFGDPEGTGACDDYFPIVHVQGNLGMQTGVGQGVLIVDGDLSATGNFHWYGIIIVKGQLFTAGTGNHLSGVTLVRSGGDIGESSTTTGNSVVQYSRCWSQKPFSNHIRPAPLTTRAWTDLSAALTGS